MSAWFGVFHPSSQGIMPGIDRRLAYSPEPCVQEDALVSGPTGTWTLIDQELQTNGLAPKIKTQRGCSLPTSHLPPQPQYHTPETKLCLSPSKGGGTNWIIQTRAPSASPCTGWAKEREKAPGKSGSGQSEAKVKVTLKVQQ